MKETAFTILICLVALFAPLAVGLTIAHYLARWQEDANNDREERE